ncbi:MAG: tRNA (N6-threonylcarbamoyladenosine(37)-N6)-methyltransferase TrmO [Planctomycetota bacterium]
MPTDADGLQLRPIGVVHSAYRKPAEAPRQPGVDDRREPAEIELFAGANFEQALEDLAGFERIWILAWFDRVKGWKPKVRPPRGEAKRGVFATRSPHRPNPIALSVARITGIAGRRVQIAETDLLEGTPVLDLKPYLPAVDAFPGSRAGWLETLPPENTVVWAPLASRQAAWLAEFGVMLAGSVERTLRLTTGRHPYRRVSRRAARDGSAAPARGAETAEAEGELAIQSWRARFRAQAGVVEVLAIGSGYTPAALQAARETGTPLHQEAVHRAFHERWGG